MHKFKDLYKTILTSFQEGDGKGSAKRLSLFVMVALIAYSVIRYTNNENLVNVVGELGILTVALAGVSEHYKNRFKPTDNKEK